MKGLSVAISAGGKSSRMGTDKSFVLLAGKPLIEHAIARVSALGQAETFIVNNKPEAYAYLGLPMVGDVIPDKGSLGGIYTAIQHSQYDDILVIGCDMPFANVELLRYMIALRGASGGPFDVIVPRVENYPEGLHAIYTKACLAPIRERIAAERLNVIGFYPKVRVRYLDEAEYEPLDPKHLSFFNVNTPEELAEAEQIAKNSGPQTGGQG